MGIVGRAAVKQQIEVGPLHQDGEPRPDVDHVDAVAPASRPPDRDGCDRGRAGDDNLGGGGRRL